MLSHIRHLIVDAEGPLIASYNRWMGFVLSSSLLIQAYLAPIFNTLLSPANVNGSAASSGVEQQFFIFFLSTLAFLVSAGVVFVVWVKGLQWLYKKHLWHRLNKKFAVFGYWDAGYTFQANNNSKKVDKPTGYVIFEQDYLGRVEAALFYGYDPTTRRYKSESSMTGYLTGSVDKACFKIVFKTRHFGDAEFSDVADIADGVEVVEVTVTSAINGYPTRLFGDFNFYRRSKVAELWGGHTLYTRKDDLSIGHVIDNGYSPREAQSDD